MCTAAAALCLFAGAAALTAQGVTTASVRGRVLDEQGGPVDNAKIGLVNTATGQRFEGTSRTGGFYNLENVPVGGPYTLNAQVIGFQPVRRTGIVLRLGQALDLDVRLQRAAVQLQEIVVTAVEQDPLTNRSRTGASAFVSDSAITRLPSFNRNFTDFLQTAPQVVGTSVAGQNNRFNNIQIDGGVNNDLFGLASSGVPGGQANARPISLEAVKEYQVLIAPFDVRQGGFTGGLINAVTKTGTNDIHGSAFFYYQNKSLVSSYVDSATGNPVTLAAFNQSQYGVTVGGPIVRDKAQFFVAADFKARNAPFSGLSIGADTTNGNDSIGVGIRQATATRVQQILTNQYGFDPGSWEAPTLKQPDANVFGKVTVQLATNSQLELSYNHVGASDDNLIRNPTATGFRDGYELTRSGYKFGSITNTARAKWNASLGTRLSNELIFGYQTVRDHRELPNRRPLIFVGGDRAGTNIAAGAERFSHDNLLNQDIIEATDNVTGAFGSHLITLGTHNEFFHFENHFFPASIGVWSFRNADSLAAARPNRFERALPGANSPIADWGVRQLGLYAQDQWRIARLTLTLGLRADVPLLDKPSSNPALATALNINSASFPSGNVLVSPRVGFNWDVTGNRESIVRGGLGIFSGRPPYVWMSNAFTNTGLEQVTLTCTGVNVPAFTASPDSQPTTCGAGAVAPIPAIVYFDSTFKYPQNLKAAFGVDHRLPGDVIATFDFVYTKWINQFYLTDTNLVGQVGATSEGAGRVMYGTINPGTGAAAPTRRSTSFRDVIFHRNESKDRSYSATIQLHRRFGDLEFSGGYTYSRVEDLMSLTSSIANSNLRFATLDGTLEQRNLRRSVFDVPHKITLSGEAKLPLDFSFGLFYSGLSGSPFTYTVSNDANADGLSGNDRVYVPRDTNDISVSGGDVTTRGAYDGYINGEKCLSDARGTILTRNTCRNPWQNFFNARLSKIIPTTAGQSLELTLDAFNLLRLFKFIDSNWGLVRQTAAFEEQSLLTVSGFDVANNRPRYRYNPANVKQRVDPVASRWRVQLGARYTF